MKYKKCLIFICLIICLFSIANVCASDMNDIIVANEDQSDEAISVENEEIISVDENIYESGATEENELSETTGTFTDLANEITKCGDELNLTRDYIYTDNKDNNIIYIDKKITINGNGFCINGNGHDIFEIRHDEVTLNNIYFLNSSGVGGTVHMKGSDGVINNCTFNNCRYYPKTENSIGGVVSWDGNNGFISNCYFVNCVGKCLRYEKNCGGAISCVGANCSVYNCSFVGCSVESESMAPYVGGAIYWNGINGSINNCTFNDCFAKSSHPARVYAYIGGSIFWNQTGGNIKNCYFKNSIVQTNFISYNGDNGYLDSCVFYDSYFSYIGWYGDNGTIVNSKFINQNNYSSINWVGSNGNLFNCSFMNCSGSVKNSHGLAIIL